MTGYFYIDTATNQQCGPFSVEELKTKNINSNTMVWCSGMTGWQKAGVVPELSNFFYNSPTNVAQSTMVSTPVQQRGIYDNNVYGQRQQRNLNGVNDVRPIPKTWLIESVLVTVFCCPAFGIVSILSASKVESLYYSGDYESSEKASKDAKKWLMIGLISAGALYAGIFLLYFLIIIGSLGMGSL